MPLLIPILNLTALSKGALPLHASAFTYRGTGVLTTGWSKGGKTETLLAFMSRGAEYIGDEWVYISADGQQMYGIPEPIRLWDWHLEQLPHYRTLVGRGDQARLRMIKFAQGVDQVISKGPTRKLFLARALERVRPVLKQQLHVDMPPRKLFGSGFGRLAGDLHKIVFVGSHATPDIIVQAIEPQEIARRMVFSLQYERLSFMSYYLAFRFAFPELRNELIEQAEQIQRERLASLLTGKDAYELYHPYPVSIAALFEAISPLLAGPAKGGLDGSQLSDWRGSSSIFKRPSTAGTVAYGNE